MLVSSRFNNNTFLSLGTWESRNRNHCHTAVAFMDAKASKIGADFDAHVL